MSEENIQELDSITFVKEYYNSTLNSSDEQAFYNYKEAFSINEWDYPLDEFDEASANNDHIIKVRFDNDDGSITYRYCECP